MDLRVLGAVAVCGLAWAMPAWATPPVIVEAPKCAHRKLDTVEIEAGSRVSEGTMDRMPTAVNYRLAFNRLAEAAQEKGANAVVMRGHRATYFTRDGRRSKQAVHVQLRGAAILIEGDPADCAMKLVSPRDYTTRHDDPRIVETPSTQAYGE